MRAVVIYESLTGNTAAAARLIAEEVVTHGVEVALYPITDIGLKELAEADIVFVGTWVDGLILFGHRPGRAGRIKAMPVIDGKRVAAFMTYAIHAGKALDRFAKCSTSGARPWWPARCSVATTSRRGSATSCPRRSPPSRPDRAPPGAPAIHRNLGESPVRSSTRRTILWALALVVALSLVGLAYVQGDEEVDRTGPPASPSPQVPDDPGDGCGAAAATDPTDLSVGRTLARCGAGAPAAAPLPSATTVRVAVPDRDESVAPLLVADALGEFDAENLVVEVVVMDQGDAYAAMAAGDVDVVVGGIDAPFFDSVHEGLAARLVLGGPVARFPSDLDTAQAGLWLRADLISDEDKWDNVESQTILAPGGLGSAALYPIDTTISQEELSPNSVDLVAASSSDAARRLQSAEVGGAWLTEPAATNVAEDGALRLVATLPGSEAIVGTVFSPRLLDAERATGLAYTPAIVRTINTWLADGYEDEASAALADALGVSADEIAAGPAPLFDWEIRSGTTARIQESLVLVGGVRYERPTAERSLVDRTLVAEAVQAEPAQVQG